jgi:hypothetical protein
MNESRQGLLAMGSFAKATQPYNEGRIMIARRCLIIAFFSILLYGCAQEAQKPIRKLTIPSYPGAHILSVNPAAPDSTPGFTYHKTVFETPDSPAKVLAWYAEAMSMEGWQPPAHPYDPATSMGYHHPIGCPQPHPQDAWIVILAQNPGVTQVEVGLREGKCRSDR